MAKLRRPIAGLLKMRFIFIVFFGCVALVFCGTSNAQSVFVDNKVLEKLGAPPNVASVMLGKKTIGQNYESLLGAQFPPSDKKPQFPIIIGGKFIPPAGKIGHEKKSKWDPSLTASPKREKRSIRNLGQKKQGPFNIKRSSSNKTVKPKLITKTAPALKPKNLEKPQKAVVSIPKHKNLSNSANKPETTSNSAVPAKAPAKTNKKPFTINFEIGTSNLNAQAQKALGLIAAELRALERRRVEVRAYASASGITESQARRLSLSRALAVRASLIALGIRSTRIDVRALGSKGQKGPSDRVDLRIN